MENSEIPVKETLLPALVQCFGIIFIGFILGKTKLLNQSQSQGLSIFVQYLSLPALIFVTVSIIPFTLVKWEFIAAVFVSKTCVFVLVVLLSIVLMHPHDFGKTGIFSMLVTQSNDFALGYPLFIALYQGTHPEFPIYLYIIAPIQLLIFNSVGFLFLETEKHTSNAVLQTRCYFLYVLKDTLKNPVVIMTIIGLIWNFTYGQIPPIMETTLKAFSDAFPATALLLLGYTMSISEERSCSQSSLLVTLLILTKCLVFPLILERCTGFFLQHHTEDVIQSLSNFGFLYGVLPSAPTVYVFATQYDTCIDVATKTIIGSTIFSAPLMFATSSLISLTHVGVQSLSAYLTLTISYLSPFNLCCSVCLLLMLVTGKRWKSISFSVIFYLVLAQILTGVGGLLLFFSPIQNSALFYTQYLISTGSIYATRCCTFLLAVLLVGIRVRSLCHILQMRRIINILSVVLGALLPYIIVATLLIFRNENSEPSFQLGFPEIVTTLTVTSACFIGTIICLVLQQVYLKKNKRSSENSSYISYQNSDVDVPAIENAAHNTVLGRICNPDIEDLGQNSIFNDCLTEPNLVVNESHLMCDSRYNCSAARRVQCTEQISRYIDENNELGTGLIDDEYFCKHVVLLMISTVAMLLSLFVCLWRFLTDPTNGVLIELEFLDVILNYSFGIVCFIIFGLDSKLMNLIFLKFQKCFDTLKCCTVSETNLYSEI